MHPLMRPFRNSRSNEETLLSARVIRLLVLMTCFVPLLSSYGLAQMSTFSGLNTVQNRLNATAAPDVTIAVGTVEYCEHVKNAYQCWFKTGPNANQPVSFFG